MGILPGGKAYSGIIPLKLIPADYGIVAIAAI